jgi:6-methylpretetramide 4-monooxygenase / 4-hydroxy-6-methylpretetramide 12a-monooxygenase
MTGMTEEPVEVLVVGAGPSGLFVALELARHDVLARVVEREPEPHHQARATAIQPGTLEMLARAGVVEEVLEASEQLPFARVLDADLGLVSELAFAGAGCRWEFQCSLPQWRTEQILTERLQELGVTVQRGVSATSLEPGDDGLRVGLERLDGTHETVQARYVIGAGGAHSVTRSTMAEVLSGETYPGTALVADVGARCAVPRDGSSLVATPQGYVLLAPIPDGRWLTFVGDLQDEEIERSARDTSVGVVANAIKRRISGEIRLEDVAWAATFRMHRRIVSSMAGERRFLLGDAGHLSSPFGGEGLNSGLHDGHNLAWKLALVLRGRGRRSLLDSFAAERLAADKKALEVSDRLHALAHGAVRAARTGVRPPPMTADQVSALRRSRSMLDISHAESPIVGEYVAPGQEPAHDLVPGERCVDQVALGISHRLLLFESPDEDRVTWLRARWDCLIDVVDAREVRPDLDGAVLVRPDGYVGFRAGTADARALAAVDRHLESYLIPGRDTWRGQSG